MEYNKKKDREPLDTVNIIKNELKKLGIPNLEEFFFTRNKTCYKYEALRVHLKNRFDIGQNGKGTTREYALASAYAEFVERLQGYNLLDIKQPDEKFLTPNTIKKSNIFSFFFNTNEKKNTIDDIIDISNQYKKNTSKIKSFTFYHLNSNNIKYLPINLILFNSYSTGIASGNNAYESLIQGLSEIFERYVLKEITINTISLPDIPEHEYINYKQLKEYVEYVKKLGYKIYVKDASLNGKFPVVCSIICNEKENTYKVNFGSHPILQIAIERCFTESLQGVDLSDDKSKLFFKPKNKKNNNILLARLHNAYIFSFIELQNEDFDKLPNWNFPAEFWHKTDNFTNEELVKYWLKELKNRNLNIFIRDMSYINFSTYQIFIPELQSIFLENKVKNEIKTKINYHKCFSIFENRLSINPKENEFLDFCKYYFHLNNKVLYKYKNIEIYYVLTLFYINKIDEAIKVLNALKANSKYKKQHKLIKFIEIYICSKKENKKHNEIQNDLTSLFGKKRSKFLIKMLFNKNSFRLLIFRIKKQKEFELKINKNKDKNIKILKRKINKFFKEHKKDQLSLRHLFNSNNQCKMRHKI